MDILFCFALPILLAWLAFQIYRARIPASLPSAKQRTARAVQIFSLITGVLYMLIIGSWFMVAYVNGLQTDSLESSLSNGFGATFAVTIAAFFSLPFVLVILACCHAAVHSLITPKE